MFKKLLCSFMAFCMVLLLVPPSSAAASNLNEDSYTIEIVNTDGTTY